MQEQKQSGTQAHSVRAITRGWRCFAGTLAVLCGFVALNLAGCGGGGGGKTGGGGATVAIQVRDPDTGVLLPSMLDPNFTPPPPPTVGPGTPTPGPGTPPAPTPTFPPQSLTVRLVGRGYDRTTTFNNPTTGAIFDRVPKNVSLQVFVDGVPSGPAVLVINSDNGTQTFQVVQGASSIDSKFLSKVVVSGITRLNFDGGACTTNTPVVTSRAYLIRVRDVSQPGNPTVALRRIDPTTTGAFTLRDLPLQVIAGKPVTTTYQAEVFSESGTGSQFSGTGPRFSLDGRAAPGSTLTFNFCAFPISVTPGPNTDPTNAPQPTSNFTTPPDPTVEPPPF